MSYLSVSFYCLLVISLLLYYALPKRLNITVLLCTSIVFYVFVLPSVKHILMFVAMVALNYGFGIAIEGAKEKEQGIKRLWMILGVLASILPFFLMRVLDLLYGTVLRRERLSFIVPVGLAFFSMQMVAYIIDVYRGETAEKNFFKHLLFMSFFPTIIQGPILCYGKIKNELFSEHTFDAQNMIFGFRSIMWGFFLKFMIADKAGVYVDKVFDDYMGFAGLYVLIAAILYSIQLYTDFYSCVLICRGAASFYGIKIPQNFDHPYLSKNIGEFWNRWHISLSSWLRDYVYIPLGGNRKGRFRKYINLLVTFLVSGLWHGGSLNFIFWGLMHGCYQIIYDLFKNAFGAQKDYHNKKDYRLLQSIVVFILAMFGWIVFRAQSLSVAFHMIASIFRTFNPWILFDGGIISYGLDAKDWNVLIISLLIFAFVSVLQNRKKDTALLENVTLPGRLIIYCVMIFSIVVFGTYGADYATQNFIYGGF